MIPKPISFSLYKYFESIKNVRQNVQILSFFHFSSLKVKRVEIQESAASLVHVETVWLAQEQALVTQSCLAAPATY